MKKKVQPINKKQLIFVLEALDTDEDEMQDTERIESLLYDINRRIKKYGGYE